MKKYQINIDLNSIKKNKNAGETQTTIYKGKEVFFKTFNLPGWFKNGENCHITEITMINGEPYMKGIIPSNELIEKCKEEKFDIELSTEPKLATIIHSPIPKYSYKYENTQVMCNNCGKKIMSNDLKINGCSFTVCPECGAFDCCYLVYEKIDDALKRAEKIIKK